jgi:hypothetical protein
VIRLLAIGIVSVTLIVTASAEEIRLVAPDQCTRPSSEDQRVVGTFGNYRIQPVRFRLTSQQWQACVAACTSEYADRQWGFTSSAILPNSSLMMNGLPYIQEKFGDPVRVEQSRDEGFFDIDIYMVPRNLFYPGFKVVTHDYIDEDFSTINLKDAEIQESGVIYELIADGANVEFQFGLAVGSSRAEVEEAIGLPCVSLANYGLEQIRLPGSPYSYHVKDPNGNLKYNFDIRFDQDGKLLGVHWVLQSWH